MSGSNAGQDPRPDTNQTMVQAERRSYVWYILPIVAVPLLMLASAFLVVPTRWFEIHSNNAYLANLGYGAKLFGQNCQVLIYGDSSAMVGVSPAIIQERTGLTACNIAEFAGMTLVSHTLLVDEFLEHNPRPRYLIFLYAPEDLSVPRDWTRIDTFEAILFRVKYAKNLDTLWLLASHPAETLGWMGLGVRLALDHLETAPMPDSEAHLRETTRGQLPMNGTPLTGCTLDIETRPPDPAWVGHLRGEYGVDGTTVLVDATPLADCDNDLPYYQRQLDGLVDNSPYAAIPVSFFGAGGRLHVNEAGSRLISAMIADQIIARRGDRSNQPLPSSPDHGGR